MRSLLLPLLALVALLGSSCSYYEKPHRPLPENFEVRLLTGEHLHPEQFRGKPWVIQLWLPRCFECGREFEEMKAIRAEFEPQGVGFLALSLEQNQARVRRAIEEWKIDMLVATATGELLGPLSVSTVPSTIFINADGTIVAAASGLRSQRFLEARVRELISP